MCVYLMVMIWLDGSALYEYICGTSPFIGSVLQFVITKIYIHLSAFVEGRVIVLFSGGTCV